MSSELYDLTFPAHDPTIPKPRGLLPVPKWVEEAVDREDRRIAREHGFHMAPEARKRMIDDTTLHYYYEGAEIAYRFTPEGVEVLAAGWDEVKEYLRTTPAEQRAHVLIGTP